MLTTSELKAHAHKRRLKLTDQIWKDYMQDMLLHLLYKKYPHLLFRGGTAIWKVLKGNRFSEDIDLCAERLPEKIDEYLQKELRLYGFVCRTIKKKRTKNILFLKFGIASPSHPREIIISVEILISKKCVETTETVTMYSPYPDIPPVDMVVPTREEIAYDKISAILNRNKTRDVHDLYILLKQGTVIDEKKLKKRVHGFTIDNLEVKLLEKKRLWKTLKPLVSTNLPSFDEEARYIMSVIKSKE